MQSFYILLEPVRNRFFRNISRISHSFLVASTNFKKSRSGAGSESQEKASRYELKSEHIRRFIQLLQEKITEYDCGKLCRQNDGGGIPYCCTTEHAVPLLYEIELEYLKDQGDLWSRWNPESGRDRELIKSVPNGQVFCACKGYESCVREQRSISCRTFPLEPYLDRRGKFVGLTFIRDFTDKDPKTGRLKCPLTARKNDIRTEYIDNLFMFWKELMQIREEEHATYVQTSEFLRREYDKMGRRFHVLFPSQIDRQEAMAYIY